MNTDSGNEKLSRKEREFQARRKEILEAATRLFARNGYHGTAMSEIAKEAEFSTGSLYNFFKNKEELYFTLLKERIEALERDAYEVLEAEGSVEERLRMYVRKLYTFFIQDQDFFRIFDEQRAQFEMSSKGEWSDLIYDKQEAFLTKMVLLMQQGVEEGLFKPINPAELTMVFVGIAHNLLSVFFRTEMPFNPEEKVDMVLDIFFNGTRKRSGEDS